MRTETEHTMFLKDYAPSPYAIDKVELDVKIGPVTSRVRALLTITPRPGTARRPMVRWRTSRLACPGRWTGVVFLVGVGVGGVGADPVAVGVGGLSLASWRAMRRAEAAADKLRGRQ